MGQMLVDVIFKILNFVAGIFLNPIFAAISSLFPALSVFFTKVLSFVNLSLSYIIFAFKALMIPSACFVPLFAIALGIFSFQIGARVVSLGMGIYNYFKP